MAKPKVTLGLRLDLDLYDQIEELAERDHEGNVSAAIRQLIRKAIETNQRAVATA